MKKSDMVNMVELRNISKSFNGIAALKNVTLKVIPGEIHALMGENGAGKSTLMKILSGAYQKDGGRIFINGAEAPIKNTRDSKQLGIGIIYQEFSLVPELSVAENVFLNQVAQQGMWLKWQRLKTEAAAIIKSIGFNIDPAKKVSSLSIAQQQIVEIAKALSESVKVLILDEPSAVLGPNEVEKLFDILRKLKKEGVAIIYISHHLDDIFTIADRVTVLKDGASSESLQVAGTDRETIIKMMLGRSLSTMFPERKAAIGQTLLRAAHIYLEDKVRNVSLYVKAGEVLGLAGLVGSGRTETLRAIFAADKKTGGVVYMHNDKATYSTPAGAVKQGIGMVPEDRKQHGVLLNLSIRQNISMGNLKRVTGKLGFIRPAEEDRISNELIKKLTIKAHNAHMPVGRLSGGNQQKVALAKWFNRGSDVIIIDEPTRGVDVGAKVEIYKLINELAEAGKGVIVISSETSELMGICDRIMVMRSGAMQGELDKAAFTEENILRLVIGAAV